MSFKIASQVCVLLQLKTVIGWQEVWVARTVILKWYTLLVSFLGGFFCGRMSLDPWLIHHSSPLRVLSNFYVFILSSPVWWSCDFYGCSQWSSSLWYENLDRAIIHMKTLDPDSLYPTMFPNFNHCLVSTIIQYHHFLKIQLTGYSSTRPLFLRTLSF